MTEYKQLGWREHLEIAQTIEPLLDKVKESDDPKVQQRATCEAYECLLSVLLPDRDWAAVDLSELIEFGSPALQHFQAVTSTAKKNGTHSTRPAPSLS